MADLGTRTVVDWTVPADGGRDANKTFRLTEMSAWQGERWALRALGAAARSNAEITPEHVRLGMMGVAQFGLRALLAIQTDELMSLLDELLTCVQYVSDPQRGIVRPLLRDDADVQESRTVYRLREEVFRLHTGFSFAGALLILASSAFPGLSTETTKTSAAPSEPSSPPGEPAPAS